MAPTNPQRLALAVPLVLLGLLLGSSPVGAHSPSFGFSCGTSVTLQTDNAGVHAGEPFGQVHIFWGITPSSGSYFWKSNWGGTIHYLLYPVVGDVDLYIYNLDCDLVCHSANGGLALDACTGYFDKAHYVEARYYSSPTGFADFYLGRVVEP